MKKRKHLCLITADIKELNARRIINGISEQCKKYDYDLSVFSTPTTLQYFNIQYTNGAINIYKLINFSKYDGIIVDTLTLSNALSDLLSDMYERIGSQAKCPVVNLSFEYGEYKTIRSQNEEILRSMCRHMIEVHGYKKFCILTGFEDNVESIQRVNIFMDEIEKHGLNVATENIFYGDFWYTSGEDLAEKIFSGAVEKPDAVLCASDHMGIGLINRLIKHGYKVPEDIAVIGFEGTTLAMLNDVPLTSYKSNTKGTAADAVDYIRSIIEPGKEIIPLENTPEECFCIGRSCGCNVRSQDFAKMLGSAIYRTERNYNDENLNDTIDIGYLMESYSYEQLCASKSLEDCMHNIMSTAFTVLPYKRLYVCLRENWNDLKNDITSGFPDKMKIVVLSDDEENIREASNENGVVFNTEEMLPGIFEAREKPYIFYFTSIHFNDTIFGYSVMQREMGAKVIDIVFRNWIRFICSALEMIRMRENYLDMSLKDPMTGLINKRGMYEWLERMMNNIKSDESIYVAVIDMDGLKQINDNYGHIEGDFCIRKLASIIDSVTNKNEISIRAGGDEFYIIGTGAYTEETLELKIKQFEELLSREGAVPDKPYSLSASIGHTLWKQEGDFDIDAIIKVADDKMYQYKISHKKARGQNL